MRITIEDLESLKELSDELEENHVETEKQLYDDIGNACKFHPDNLLTFCQSNAIFKFANFSGRSTL